MYEFNIVYYVVEGIHTCLVQIIYVLIPICALTTRHPRQPQPSVLTVNM